MFNLFGNDNNDDQQCPTSGWTVRPAVTHRDNGRGDQCPDGDHDVVTTPVRSGIVRIQPHRR